MKKLKLTALLASTRLRHSNKNKNRFVALAVVVAACGLVGACQSDLDISQSQHSIWGGTEDFEHTSVVSVNISNGEGGWNNICSGTLVAPTVVITAGHCTYGQTEMAVAFAQDIAPGWPIDSSVEQHTGTATTHPEYMPHAASPMNSDIGVIILDAPVNDVAPMPLPSAGALSVLKNKDPATLVGFGMSSALGLGNGGDLSWTDERRQASVAFNSMTPGVLKFTPQFDGDGGVCFGDSGGASLVDLGEGEVLAGVIVVGDASCVQLAKSARTDTAMARDFFGQFMTLP